MKSFTLQLWAELRKLFARPRTYLGFGVFFILEVLVLLLLQLPRVQNAFRRLISENGYGFDEYFSGVTLGFLVLMATWLTLGPLYLALVSGDLVAKEAEDGTLRMILCRPLSRFRLLALKFCAGAIYTFALVLFIALSALAVGLLKQGPGGLFVYAPQDDLFALYGFGEGVARYLSASVLMGASMLVVTSMGFAFSCCNIKPAAATIATLSVFFVDFVFHRFPFFESIHPWLFTTHMGTWMNALRPLAYDVMLWRLLDDYAYLGAVNATLLILGGILFLGRDLKS